MTTTPAAPSGEDAPAPESPNVARQGLLSAIMDLREEMIGVGCEPSIGSHNPFEDALGRIDFEIAASQGAAPDPSADRSAKAVAPDAWQFLGSSPQSGITEPFPTGRWRECLDPKAAKDAGYEVRPLWTHPPAQPASPGPLQPEVTDEHFIIGLRLALCQPDIDQDDIDTAREHAKLIAARAALSADHDAKEAK